jgi:hypothetical protein
VGSVIQEIEDLLVRIESDYPEVYIYLDEDPTTLHGSFSESVTESDLIDYRESLREKLRQFKAMHPS